MNQHSRLYRAGAVLALSSSFVGLLILPALSQREEFDGTAFLFDGADCVTSGSHWRSETIKAKPNTRVPINRQVYDQLFRMQATNSNTVTLSCRAKSKKDRYGKIVRYGRIVLDMGIPDTSLEDGVAVKVDIYQGSNLRYSYENLRPRSKISNVVLDLNDRGRNPDNFSIEMSCNSKLWCYLDFVTARLYPAGTMVPSGTGNGGTAPPNTEPQAPATGATREDAPLPGASRQDGSGSQLGGQVVEKVIDSVFRKIFK